MMEERIKISDVEWLQTELEKIETRLSALETAPKIGTIAQQQQSIYELQKFVDLLLRRSDIEPSEYPKFDNPISASYDQGKYDVNLLNEFDASVWADQWLIALKQHPDLPNFKGAMMTWFTGAIMAGYNHAKNQKRESDPLPAAPVKREWVDERIYRMNEIEEWIMSLGEYTDGSMSDIDVLKDIYSRLQSVIDENISLIDKATGTWLPCDGAKIRYADGAIVTMAGAREVMLSPDEPAPDATAEGDGK